MLKIGLSMGFMHPDPDRGIFEKKRLSFVENDMANFFSSNNSTPISILDIDDTYLDQTFDLLDGLVLTGGADLAPSIYNEEMIEDGRWPGDAYRDAYEFKLIKKALKRKMPILGICRGHQIINAYFGGSLYQDIATQTKTKTLHRDGLAYDEIKHDVQVVNDSYLSSFYSGVISVNSIHHQAIKDLAPNLVALAHSTEDQLIEATCHQDMQDQYILSVQWHPEFSHTLADKVVDPTPLLDDFLEACRR